MSGLHGHPARQRERPLSPAEPRPDGPNGTTAIAAGLLGLVAAAVSGYLPVTLFIGIPSGFSLGDLSPWTLVDLAAYLIASLVLLIGAVSTFLRTTAGALLLIAGGLFALGALLLEPALAGSPAYVEYFRTLFRFENFAAVDRVALLGSAVLVLILAGLPRTFGYLRHRAPAVPATSPSRQW
ncbi:hypothetical protein [Amycolatopsis benzoatilytica]|uniref:hypothetical protein n=1 Tax=Amycolatopsis benzoatilytica TaxID=346045 RepID=UPI000361B943|nr:hypothetical protein [Amycolatopsis benzoatilytica]